jgi:hypothetical protein
MLSARMANSAAKSLTIAAREVGDEIGDWVCVAAFVAMAVVLTMAPFILL